MEHAWIEKRATNVSVRLGSEVETARWVHMDSVPCPTFNCPGWTPTRTISVWSLLRSAGFVSFFFFIGVDFTNDWFVFLEWRVAVCVWRKTGEWRLCGTRHCERETTFVGSSSATGTHECHSRSESQRRSLVPGTDRPQISGFFRAPSQFPLS